MNRLRDLDTSTGQVQSIGDFDATYLTSTGGQVVGTRQSASGSSTMGEIVAFSLLTGTQDTIGRYSGKPGYLALDDTYVFWSDISGTIMKVARLGGAPEIVVSSPFPQGIALDADYVYWTDASLGAVFRVPKSGGASEPLASGQDTPVQIAVDDAFVYWTDTSDLGLGSVMRVNKSGGAVTILATGLGIGSDQHRGSSLGACPRGPLSFCECSEGGCIDPCVAACSDTGVTTAGICRDGSLGKCECGVALIDNCVKPGSSCICPTCGDGPGLCVSAAERPQLCSGSYASAFRCP